MNIGINIIRPPPYYGKLFGSESINYANQKFIIIERWCNYGSS